MFGYSLHNYVQRDSERRKEPKRMMATPTMEGLIFTSNNMIGLSDRLLKEMPRIALGTFTQDVLEAFFGNLVRRDLASTCMFAIINFFHHSETTWKAVPKSRRIASRVQHPPHDAEASIEKICRGHHTQ